MIEAISKTARGPSASLLTASIATAAFAALLFAMPILTPLFHAIAPEARQVLYSRASFAALAIAHLKLVALATGLAAVLGIGIGVAVTRRAGRAFAPLVRTIATIGQTFPPVAVLALAVPLLGYGAAPTVAALIIYAALPILEATLAGIGSVPNDARDAAAGLGFSPSGVLRSIEAPLAMPLIIAGLRNAAIINIGTATIGSSVGALSLGSPILEGLSASNPAYVLEGAVVVACLAITTDLWFNVLEPRRF